ncbi:MAG: PSD1 and planctomycete cytochrome C domain-containing protein [Planctomycetia bacterium]|nr:PSD1 and planctomycete cytochrome C domain-containing protein [Planctomycetia bacterium]
MALLFAGAPAGAAAPQDAGLAFFEQKIRPVLVEHCYSCHSQAAKTQKKLQAELFLDSQEGMLYGGESGPTIVKGKSAESLLIKALLYDGFEMPPTGKLPAGVVDDFKKWVDMGAPDPRVGNATAVPAKRVIDVAAGRKFWSFQPLHTAAPPEVKDAAWGRTPIDRFVRAAQEQQGIVPNGPTSPETLVRRAYYDLIGLPPSPEEVALFLNDKSPDAYAKLLDRLLASPRYGERWGRHWLDVARYAESGGYEFDGFRPGAYHYRDWVIRALNDDLPYDEFVRMQIAGDKLKPGDYQAVSAAGFFVAGPYPGQITSKTVERFRYDQLDDMLMTMGGSMLGLTLGCVRCHDHKYDPIPATDYYALAASLERTAQGTSALDPDVAASRQALVNYEQQRKTLDAALAKFAESELPARFTKWQQQELPKLTEEPRWQVLAPLSTSSGDTWLTMHDGGLVATTAGGRIKQSDIYVVATETYQEKLTALRLDALTDKALPKKGPGLAGDGSFALADFKVTARPLDPTNKTAPIVLKLKAVQAAHEAKMALLAAAVDQDANTNWKGEAGGRDNSGVFEIEGGLPGFPGGTGLTFELKFAGAGLGRFRIAMSTEPNPATWAGEIAPQNLGEIRAIVAAGKNQLTAPLRTPMVRWFARYDDTAQKAYAALETHLRQPPRVQLVDIYTAVAGGQDVYLLRRGEVDNKQGRAAPGFIQVLATADDGNAHWLAKPADAKALAVKTPAAKTPVDPRLALAEWITDAKLGAGQLLARVIVNRLWKHHFGEGLVGTPNDFGAQGERPSHPELLDWLAGELIRGGWKLKPLHKLMMTSAAYMQDGIVAETNRKLDPENRLLWHRRPQRLEAEILRDALLAVGGALDVKMYGPSVLDDSLRRSVYLRVKRSELIPLMTMFDAPEPTQSIGERANTTVPTQALTLMNSPFVRKMAEGLARRVNTPAPLPSGVTTSSATVTSATASTVEAAIVRAYEIALCRKPMPHELTQMREFVLAQAAALGGASPANVERALTEMCQVMLCVNEFVYVD